MDNEDKLREFNAEHDKHYSTSPPELMRSQQGSNPGSPPTGLSPADQKLLFELQEKMKAQNANMSRVNHIPTQAPVHSTPPTIYRNTTNVKSTGNECPECGTMHPPLLLGQKCPNARVNLKSISDEEIGNFLANMRNIIISQVEKREIKDAKKLFQQSIVILTKFLEEYKEDANAKVQNPTGETTK